MEDEEVMEKAGLGRMCERWFEKGRCTLPFYVECWGKPDCCWVEVYLVTLTFWGYNQISNIGHSLTYLFTL